jgi:YVTN family beta-propeller protein
VNAITVGSGPAGIAAVPGSVWVANSSDGTVSRIDLRTDRPLAPISVGQSADELAVGFGSVWVTSEASGTVTRMDERSGNLIASIQTGSSAAAVTTGEGSVWMANDLDGTVTRIDPATDTIAAAIPVGDGPDGVAVAGGSVWVSNEVGGTLARIDPNTNTVVDTVATGNWPAGVVPVSGSLFVPVRSSGAGHRGGTLTVLDSGGPSDLADDDPAVAYTPSEDQIASLTNDGLTGFRRVGGAPGTYVVPDLAVSLPEPTDGGRTYTFKLRPNIRYSTGAVVKPEDFRWAIERAIDLDFRLCALLRRDRWRTTVPRRTQQAVQPPHRNRHRRPGESRHLPPHSARPGRPRPACTASRRRGPRWDAPPSARVRACHRAIRGRVLRSKARHPPCAQPDVS